MVDVGPAAGPRRLGRAHGPLVVLGGIVVFRLVIERAIAECRREREGVGVGVGLLAGVADPVGDAGLLGDVTLVGSGGVVVLCHGRRRRGGWVRLIGHLLIITTVLFYFVIVTLQTTLPGSTRFGLWLLPCYPRLSGSSCSSPLSPHECLPHRHEASLGRNGTRSPILAKIFSPSRMFSRLHLSSSASSQLSCIDTYASRLISGHDQSPASLPRPGFIIFPRPRRTDHSSVRFVRVPLRILSKCQLSGVHRISHSQRAFSFSCAIALMGTASIVTE